jgi:hypothetical protein
MNRIHIYINIAVIGDVNFILKSLLGNINKSGLYDFCEKIYLIVNGDINLLDIEVLDKYIVVNDNKDISKVEFPTLFKIWQDSQKEDFNILYLHTKGVTRNNPNIEDWTNYLSYFNINRWKDRLLELESNDCSGVNLSGKIEDLNYHPSTWGYGKAPVHYSGNFWWSKSSYIKKLPNPYEWIPSEDYIKWRVMAEMWLCQLNDRYYNAYSSNINHYLERYPKENYE